jgi:hypothetical protein
MWIYRHQWRSRRCCRSTTYGMRNGKRHWNITVTVLLWTIELHSNVFCGGPRSTLWENEHKKYWRNEKLRNDVSKIAEYKQLGEKYIFVSHAELQTASPYRQRPQFHLLIHEPKLARSTVPCLWSMEAAARSVHAWIRQWKCRRTGVWICTETTQTAVVGRITSFKKTWAGSSQFHIL